MWVKYFAELNTDEININTVTHTPLVGLSNENQIEISEKAPIKIENMTMVGNLQLKEYFARPILLTTIVVGTYTGLPLPIFYNWKTRVQNKLTGYKYFRGCCKITLMYSGNPTATGTEIVAFYPEVAPSTASLVEWSLPDFFEGRESYCTRQFLQLPHLQVNVEQKCNESICLPYPNSTGTILIATGNDWYMNSVTLNPVVLNSGLTPNPLRIDVYVSYEDVELYGPIFEEGPAEGSDRQLSRALQFSSRIARAVGSIFPVVSPWEKILSTAGDLAHTFGWAKPIEVPVNMMITRANTNISYMSGQPDFSEKLSMSPYSTVDVSGYKIPLNSEDDTKILSIAKKWGLIWTTNIVGDYEVVPLLNFDSSFGVKRVFTPLAYMSMGFMYWRGTIELKFEFVSNALLRQRVALYIVPPGAVAPTTYVPGIQLLTTIVDIVGRTEAIIKVPYYSVNNFESVNYYSGSINYTRVAIVYIAPTDGQAGTPSNIFHNVYIRAGDDFELCRPTLGKIRDFVVKEGPVICEGPVTKLTMGEDVEDLLELFKRPIYSYNLAMVANTTYSLPMYGLPPNVTSFGYSGSTPISFSSVPIEASYLSFYGALFLGMSGGMRIKLVRVNTGITATPPVIMAGVNYTGAGQLAIDVNALYRGDAKQYFTTPVVEIECPSRIIGNFTSASQYFSNEFRIASSRFTDNIMVEALGVAETRHVYVSTADDFLLRGFLCTPTLELVV